MSLFKNRSFNVKIVKDKDVAVTDENRENRTADGIYTAEAYSRIVQDLVAGVAGTILVTTVGIVAAKCGADILRTGFKKLAE